MGTNTKPRVITGSEAEFSALLPSQIEDGLVFSAPSFTAVYDLESKAWRFSPASDVPAGGRYIFKFSGGLRGRTGINAGFLSDASPSSQWTVIASGVATLQNGSVTVGPSLDIPLDAQFLLTRKNVDMVLPEPPLQPYLSAHRVDAHNFQIKFSDPNGALGDDNSEIYWSIVVPELGAFASSIAMQYPVPSDGKLKSLRLRVRLNSLVSDVSAVLHINNAPTLSVITVPAGQSGLFSLPLDLPVSAGDTVDLSLSNDSGVLPDGGGVILVSAVIDAI